MAARHANSGRDRSTLPNCEQCSGTGIQTISAPCRHCKGIGEVAAYNDDGSENLVACIHCEYGLVYLDQTCPTCHGTGAIERV